MATRDFPSTSRHTSEELRTALAVIRTFKGCEDRDEWFSTFFTNWQKLEQLEDYLAEMTGEKKEEVRG